MRPGNAPSTNSSRSRAQALERDGDLRAAIGVLHATNREHPDPEIEVELVRLRHEAFFAQDAADEGAADGPPVWPPDFADPFPEVRGRPPEITGAELDAEVLGGGLRHHGALLVREMVPAERVTQLRADIDRAFDAREAAAQGASGPSIDEWYRPFVPSRPSQFFNDRLRAWNRDAGAMWAADAPRALFDLVDTYTDLGLGDVISGYLGEEAALSVNKCTLRRVGTEAWPAWHQDGSFIPGERIRTVDVWLSLSDCGGDGEPPALDLIPRRLDFIAETGGPEALNQSSVGQSDVERIAGDTPVVRPRFAPGDALLFDEMLLHCTGVDARAAGQRHAIEAWFFARSCFPHGYVPFVF